MWPIKRLTDAKQHVTNMYGTKTANPLLVILWHSRRNEKAQYSDWTLTYTQMLTDCRFRFGGRETMGMKQVSGGCIGK